VGKFPLDGADHREVAAARAVAHRWRVITCMPPASNAPTSRLLATLAAVLVGGAMAACATRQAAGGWSGIPYPPLPSLERTQLRPGDREVRFRVGVFETGDLLRIELPAGGGVHAVLYSRIVDSPQRLGLPPACRVTGGEEGEMTRACELTGTRATWMSIVEHFDSAAAPDATPAPASRVSYDSLHRQHISGTFTADGVSAELDDRRGESFRHVGFGGGPLAQDLGRLLDSLKRRIGKRANQTTPITVK
jgi:hypothetical protein